jgi:large subunit ribosomal protein L13
MYKQKTFRLNPNDAKSDWWVVDASGKTLGRLATEIAVVLMGKNKPTYTPTVDSGDFVVVLNTDQIQVSGNKATDKRYFRYTGFIGGIKNRTFSEQMARDSRQIIFKAVKGMLPKNNLARKQLKKLKVFSGAEHTHSAQNPQILKSSRQFKN